MIEAPRSVAARPENAAVVEVGGSGASVWRLAGGRVRVVTERGGAPSPAEVRALVAAAARDAAAVLLATPGRAATGGRLHAANLGWDGIRLGALLGGYAAEVRWVNDAAAIAAGERTLHRVAGRAVALVFGTGLGIAAADAHGAEPVMWQAEVEAAHLPTGGEGRCPCGRTGCLELLARRWVRGGAGGPALARALATVCQGAGADAVVLAGGAMRDDARRAELEALLAPHLGAVPLFASAAAEGQKSAAPHGFATVWPGARVVS